MPANFQQSTCLPCDVSDDNKRLDGHLKSLEALQGRATAELLLARNMENKLNRMMDHFGEEEQIAFRAVKCAKGSGKTMFEQSIYSGECSLKGSRFMRSSSVYVDVPVNLQCML